MTHEEKELLLKDLCGRLPYATIYDIKIGGVTHLKVSLNAHIYKLIEENWNNGQLQSITPYLRKQNRTKYGGIYLENLGCCYVMRIFRGRLIKMNRRKIDKEIKRREEKNITSQNA